MDEDQLKNWTKQHKQKIIEDLFGSERFAKEKKAIFLAGIPGSGKTELVERAKQALSPPYPVIIEHDRLVESITGYKPENYYSYRSAGSILVTELFKRCLNDGWAFILDSTLVHRAGRQNIDKALRRGYQVTIWYLIQSASQAWELTRNRKMIHGRDITKPGFIETCGKINDNLLDIFNRYHSNPQFRLVCFDKRNVRPGKPLHELDSNHPQDKKSIVSNLRTGYNYDTRNI